MFIYIMADILLQIHMSIMLISLIILKPIKDQIEDCLLLARLSMYPRVQAAYDRLNHSQPPEEEPGWAIQRV